MLEFREIDKESIINDIAPYLKLWTHKNSIYTPCVLYMWSDFIGARYCIEDGVFYFKQKIWEDETIFGMPLGGRLDESVPKVLEYARGEGHEAVFFVPHSVVMEMSRYFDLTSEKQESDFDYIYLAEDLIQLKGKKFHAKRNYISRFKRENPDYEYKRLTKEQVPYIKDFMREFIEIDKECTEFNSSDNYEKCRAAKVLDSFEELGLTGGVLYVKGKVIGFTVGAKIGDMLYVHIEKGSRDYVGTHEILNNSYAASNAEGIVYINREDDLGNPGLRKSKESYNPIARLYNYKVRILGKAAK